MKKLLYLMMVTLLTSCGNKNTNEQQSDNAYELAEEKKTDADVADLPRKDTGKGIGQITEVTLNTPLDQERVKRGNAIYEMKCSACHKLTGDRLVGPGWKGVTERRKPEWIMNMVTNVDVMLDKDPEAQKLLELCLTRMPNQNVSIGDARDVLEFMRQNDGVK